MTIWTASSSVLRELKDICDLCRFQALMAGVPPTVRLRRRYCMTYAHALLKFITNAFFASQGPKSAAEIEKEQEAKLKAKYNNIGAKKKLMPKVWYVLMQGTEKTCGQAQTQILHCRITSFLTLLTGLSRSRE